MGRKLDAALLFGLSGAGLGLLFGWTTSFPSIRDPSLTGARCFTQSGTRFYEFLPEALNNALCTFNVVFQGLKQSDMAMLLVNQFAALVFVIAAIIPYEAFRSRNFLARRGHFFLFLSQIATAAATFPLYYSILAYTRTPGTMSRRPSTPQIWSVLLSAVIGYLGPTYVLAKSGWSYDSLSLWQIYPLYIAVLNTILPVILSPFTKNRSPTIPIYIILAISVYLSAKAHFSMLATDRFQDIYLVNPPSATLAGDAHRLFLVDFLCSLVSTATYLVLAYDSASAEHKLGYGFVLIATGNMLGPGAAIALVWALREILGVESLASQQAAKVEPAGARAKAE